MSDVIGLSFLILPYIRGISMKLPQIIVKIVEISEKVFKVSG